MVKDKTEKRGRADPKASGQPDDERVKIVKRRRGYNTADNKVSNGEADITIVKRQRRKSPEGNRKRTASPTILVEPPSKKAKKAVGPPAPTRPKGGRPAHRDRGIRTDKAKSANLTGLDPPATPPNKAIKISQSTSAVDTFLSPQSSRIAAFTTQQPVHFSFTSPSRTPKRASRTGPEADQSIIKSTGSKPGRTALNAVKRDGWQAAGSCLSVETYMHFEEWKNDYQPQHYHQAASVKLIHLGNPCDRPQDIRARKWILAWNTPDRKSPDDLVGKRRPVMRIVYSCSGHCQHGGDDKPPSNARLPLWEDESYSDNESDASEDPEEQWEDTDALGYVDITDSDASFRSEEADGDDSDSDSGQVHGKNNDGLVNKPLNDLTDKELNARLDGGCVKRAATRRPRSKCKVTLHAEVYSDDLSKVFFFQKGSHQAAREQHLDVSPYIRQCVLELARTLGLSPSSIKRRLLRVFEENKEHHTPRWRRPSSIQVNNMVNNARRKERLLSDPLLSIGVFAAENPDKIFNYVPPNYNTEPPTEFATGIHHPYGTQCMLLWASEHGIGHDATYRHMNENRAPLTLMITLDTEGRMVPGFAYLSGDTKKETQIVFLKEAKRLVEEMAKDLVEGRASVAPGLKSRSQALMAQAHDTVKNGWRPKFFMIDKYRSSKNAIKHVFPGVPIRICQFHVMQAILRWERDHGAPGHARPTLDNVRKHQLLWAVREIQRCRALAEWPQYVERFRGRLNVIADGSSTDSETLFKYFDDNWFCDEWREHWTDMGLPAGENRHGMLSTNNWTERAFKTFNQVFLGNRNNKSIFRLVLILANEWFSYYQEWEPKKRQFSTRLFRVNARGHALWSCEGAVQPFTMENGHSAWRIVDSESS